MAKVLVITNCKMCPYCVSTNVDVYTDPFHYCSKMMVLEVGSNFLGTDEDIETISDRCPLKDAEEE